jgi:DNA-binding MarR family transcriptional regulator
MENTGTPPKGAPKPKKLPLTPSQLNLIAAIHKLRSKKGLAPSYKELTEDLGLSQTVVATRIRKLQERGYLGAAPGRYRNVFVTRKGHLALGAARKL